MHHGTLQKKGYQPLQQRSVQYSIADLNNIHYLVFVGKGLSQFIAFWSFICWGTELLDTLSTTNNGVNTI